MSVQVRKWSGKPIAMPGIVASMPIDRYHAADACIEPSVSSGGLRKIFNKSPKHYWAESPYNPDRIDPEDTEAMIFGRASHHLLFGETEFKKVYTVRPATINGEAWHASKLICKGWLKKAESDGLTVLTPTQLDHIKGMAKSLAEEPLVKAGILNGAIEQSYFWKDTETGLWIKVRPDANPNDSLDFADLKTTTSVLWPDLRRTIYDQGYFQQGALVADACQHILKRPMNSFSLVFIEKKPPYCCRIVTLKENEIKRGQQCNRIALRTFADCFKAKHWPGPGGDQDDAAYIEMNEWDQKRLDERIKLQLGDAQ